MTRKGALSLAVGVLAAIAAPLLAGLDDGPQQQPADLVLRHGRVVTVDPAIPEAQAVAFAGDRILAVGTDAEIARLIGPKTEVIDLGGKLAIPGFVESHGHFLDVGQAKMILDLTKAQSWGDIVSLVEAAAKKAEPGAWITGRGWHQERWKQVPEPNVDGVPLHHELSRVSPANPVLLDHASGHAAFANAKALELAGVTKDTANPPGGEVVRDAQGNPTGLLRETAQGLVIAALEKAQAGRDPRLVETEMRRRVELAGQEALSKGVTSFHDAGSPFVAIDFFKRLADEGKLPVRLYVMVRRETNEAMAEKLAKYRTIGYGNHFLTVRSIKRQIDGALGAHGALLLAPYLDLPGSTGLTLEDPAEIRRTLEIAIQNGFQVNTHAIGDRANREMLDLYEQVFRAHPDKKDLRWRIEHAQHLHPDDVPRFAKLGIIASMQGIHATSDGPWVLKRLGPERAKSGAYVWRSLIDSGAIIANGTDTPVEDIDPIACFYATVTRRMANGELFYPAQKMTREEALRSYTLNGAYAAFEEDVKGSITPGKLGDVVVLSKDIMKIPDTEIPTAKVVLTILGGKVRWRSPESPQH
ncbi:MAG TPA: amidohydrolase [Thermoanaerobaculia bacterium]|nr:amidohydrolase [Thermoanaerobaculia bacterium]